MSDQKYPDGTLIEENGYDPWGRLRDPETLALYAPEGEPELFLGRGFTGHEYLGYFGLVNMKTEDNQNNAGTTFKRLLEAY